MSKKLQKNGLFESSRMMLPEHKEAYIQHQQNLRKKSRPLLDEQEIEHLSGMISNSMLTGREVKIVSFDEFEEKTVTGKVTKIDQHKRTIKLTNEMGNQLIPFNHIIDVLFV